VGNGLRSVVINVCCHDMAASDWAATFGREKDGIACLRLALDCLREHYDGPQRELPRAA
jgi:hypothetical protein